MTHTWTHQGVTYEWIPAHTPDTLYGFDLDPASTVPDGMALSLRNRYGAVLLTLRGEMHGDEIAFFHITRGQEIGAWVPVVVPPPSHTPVPFAPAMTEGERQERLRSKIAKKLGWA